MAGVVARLVVVFVAVVIPGGVTSQDCNTGDVQVSVDEGQVKVIKTEHIRWDFGGMTIYVKVKTGFEGVRLDVQGTDGSEHTAWFPKDKCLLQSDEWLQVIARAEIHSDKKLKLEFISGTCNKYCERDNPPPKLQTLKVVAYGPSNWNTTHPSSGCKVTNAISKEYEETCQSPPTTTTITNTTTTITTTTTNATITAINTNTSTFKLSHKRTIIIASSTAGVVMVVMVVVVVVLRRRKVVTGRQTTTTAGLAHQHTEAHVIQNEIYESFDNLATDGPSPVHGQTPHTIQNDLYESVSGYDHR